MWHIKELLRSMHNLAVWFPVIWKDRPWDSWYIENLLLHKITLIRNETKKRQSYVGWENDVKWMNRCIELLTMISKHTYWEDRYDKKVPARRGFSAELINNPEWLDFMYGNTDITCADIWVIKARTLFWKIFLWKYEKWWD